MPCGTRLFASGRWALALATASLTLLAGCSARPPALESVRAVTAAERNAPVDAGAAAAPTTTAAVPSTTSATGPRTADRSASTDTSAQSSAGARPTTARPRPSTRAERPKPAPARSTATSSRGTPSRTAAPDGRTLRAVVTFYAAYDNDPPGSRAIAYPNERHGKAGGTGTYDDPITFASAEGTIPVGTRLYYPPLQKYFVMEDQCATCGDSQIDLYAGSATDSGVIECEEALTPAGRVAVELDPPPGRPVDTTPLYDDGRCITG
jgi:3D (Asp-Asp-Asp) domain-containing protein